MRLGDFFNGDLVRKAAERNVEPGNVIVCNIPLIDHPKFLVPLSRRDNLVGGILINSNINWNVNSTTELAELQYPVLRRNNMFLDHDSFADCSQLFPQSYDALVDQLVSNSYTHIGKLVEDDLSEILRLVTASPTITKAELIRYGFV